MATFESVKNTLRALSTEDLNKVQMEVEYLLRKRKKDTLRSLVMETVEKFGYFVDTGNMLKGKEVPGLEMETVSFEFDVVSNVYEDPDLSDLEVKCFSKDPHFGNMGTWFANREPRVVPKLEGLTLDKTDFDVVDDVVEEFDDDEERYLPEGNAKVFVPVYFKEPAFPPDGEYYLFDFNVNEVEEVVVKDGVMKCKLFDLTEEDGFLGQGYFLLPKEPKESKESEE